MCNICHSHVCVQPTVFCFFLFSQAPCHVPLLSAYWTNRYSTMQTIFLFVPIETRLEIPIESIAQVWLLLNAAKTRQGAWEKRKMQSIVCCKFFCLQFFPLQSLNPKAWAPTLNSLYSSSAAFTQIVAQCHLRRSICTGWLRLIGCLKLQDIFRKRATNITVLLQKMTYKGKASMTPRHPVAIHPPREPLEFFVSFLWRLWNPPYFIM